MAGLKDRILTADDLPFEDTEVPEWGVKVRIRGLSGTERDAYEAESVRLKNQGRDMDLHLKDFRARLVVRCLFDPETDERIFKDGDVGMLGMKSGKVLTQLYTVASHLSGMGDEAKAEAKANLDEAGDSSTG